jgi:two-component system sensor histidine kinase/response regulator
MAPVREVPRAKDGLVWGAQIKMLSDQVSEQAAVLVVDDNPLIVSIVKSLLNSVNYQVYTAENGKEALEVLDRKVVDVIVCDVMMPMMDGYELHAAVRGAAPLAHIPFIFLTALGDAVDINHGKELGADDYLIKPFDPRDLLSVVKGKVVRSRNLKHFSEERFDTYRKRVVHVLSHEFRTPLVAINTGAEILLDNKGKLETGKVTNLLEAIHRGGQRLERLVTDFMLLQQIEAGIAQRLFDQRSTECSVTAVVRQFLDAEQEGLEAEGFKVTFESMCPDAAVRVYEPHLLDILNRLTSNVRKFKSQELVLDILVYERESSVVIEVRDRGIGMDVDKTKEAVDLFGQLDREKLEQQGGGIGLAIASRYAAIFHGSLTFERRKGGGTAVGIVIPLLIHPKT